MKKALQPARDDSLLGFIAGGDGPTLFLEGFRRDEIIAGGNVLPRHASQCNLRRRCLSPSIRLFLRDSLLVSSSSVLAQYTFVPT
jgi:hypothetical protein